MKHGLFHITLELLMYSIVILKGEGNIVLPIRGQGGAYVGETARQLSLIQPYVTIVLLDGVNQEMWHNGKCVAK